ncbi:hypothetical protein ACFL7M_13000 [Thermodesulfobacteriota bacterium]
MRNRDTVLASLDLISKSDSIKVVVIIGSPDKAGSEGYIEFCHQILGSELGLSSIQRMCNVVDQFINAIPHFNKIVLKVNSGMIISLFLNMSLACDYRIITGNIVFQNPYVDLGMAKMEGA